MGKFTDPEFLAYVQKRQKEEAKKGKPKKPSLNIGAGGVFIGNKGDIKKYEKEYFDKKGVELKNMVNNVVASNPDKYGMKVTKGANGYPVYTLTNKEKQAEMQEKLANAKTPAEKQKIKAKYEPLINAKVSDPRISLTSGGAGKYKNRISNAQGRAMMGPIQLGNFLEGKPFTDDHNKLGVKAAKTTGGNNFFSQVGGAISGAVGGITKAASDILSGATKATVAVGGAPLKLVADATKWKELKDINKNIERESNKGIDVASPIATQLAASTFVPGYAAVMAGANASNALGSGDIGGALLSGGMAYLSSGAASGQIANLAESLGTSPEMTRTLVETGLKGGKSISEGDLTGAAMAGLTSLGAAGQIDPSTVSQLTTGLRAVSGDLKAAALQAAGSYAGFSPEQIKMASSLSEGNITEAGALAAGLDPKLVDDVKSGKFQNALTSGLTSGLAMAGGQAAAEAGIDPSTYNQAMDITRSITDPKAREKALLKLGSTAGLDPNQVKLLQSATTGDLEQEALSQAGGAAGLTKEQIQVGRTLASEGTRGLTDMAKNEATKITDKYMKDAAGRTIYGANNAPIFNPNYDQAAADILQLERIQATLPAAGETVQQYADRMGLDPNVILEQNVGKGLSLGKAIPRGMELSLPKGFTPPTPGQEEPGFFDTISQKAGDIWSSVTGGDKKDKKKPATGKEDKSFLDKAQDFIAGNKDIIGTGVQAGSAYLGYKAGQEASEEAEKLAKQQLAEIQAQGKPFMQMTFDPERYKQERAFLQERIARGGLTKEEEALQKQGDLRAARAAAAARLAGVEQQARLGGAAMGTSALASSLAGSQALLGEQSQTNLAREQAAARNLESALQRGGALSTQQTQEEANLAQSQGQFGLQRTEMAGGARGELGNIEMARAAALQNLYGRGADLATNVLSGVQPSQPRQTLPSTKPAEKASTGTKPQAGKKPPTSTTPPASNRAPAAQPQAPATPSYESYDIKGGDNLSKIAAQRGLTVEQIMAANPQIKDPNKIQAGAKLNIPSPQAQPAASTNLQTRAGAAQQVSNKRQVGTVSTPKPTSGVVGDTFNALNAPGITNIKEKTDKLKSGAAKVQDLVKNKDKLLKNPKQAFETGKELFAMGKSLFGDEET